MGFARDGCLLKHGFEIEPNQEEPRFAGRGAPHNNWIELTARGCHAGRLRVRRASSPPGLLLRRRPCGPCSQLIQALYGRSFGPSKRDLGASARKGFGPWSWEGIHRGRFSGLGRNEFLRGCFGPYALNYHGPSGVALNKPVGSSSGMFGRPGKEASIRAAREEVPFGLEKSKMKWASRGMDAS